MDISEILVSFLGALLGTSLSVEMLIAVSFVSSGWRVMDGVVKRWAAASTALSLLGLITPHPLRYAFLAATSLAIWGGVASLIVTRWQKRSVTLLNDDST